MARQFLLFSIGRLLGGEMTHVQHVEQILKTIIVKVCVFKSMCNETFYRDIYVLLLFIFI